MAGEAFSGESGNHSSMDQVYTDLSNELKDPSPEEKEIAYLLEDIALETELPKFPVNNTTNVLNKNVLEKVNALSTFVQIKNSLIPETLTKEIPFELWNNTEILETAPWANMVHAWMKVTNYCNTIAEMQMKGEINRKDIVAIAHELYKFTTNANDEKLLRGDADFLEGGEYTETRMRKAGTKGVNSERHVCMEEMKYILNTVKESFKK